MDVAEWLRSLGLERYAQAFQDAEVTPEVLPELTEADLRELGLPLGPRKMVLKAIQALGSIGGSRPCRAFERRLARRNRQHRPRPSGGSSR